MGWKDSKKERGAGKQEKPNSPTEQLSGGGVSRTRYYKTAIIIIAAGIVGLTLLYCVVNHSKGVNALAAGDAEYASVLAHKDFLFSNKLRIDADLAAGKACYRQGQYDRALEFFSQCGSAAEDEVNCCVVKILIQEEKFLEAEDYLKKCHESTEKARLKDEYFTALGVSAVKKADLEKAKACFENCRENPEGLAYRSVISLIEGDSAQEAGCAIEDAIARYPTGIDRTEWSSLLKARSRDYPFPERLKIEAIIRNISPDTAENIAIAEIIKSTKRNELIIAKDSYSFDEADRDIHYSKKYIRTERGLGEPFFDDEAFCAIESKQQLYADCGSDHADSILIVQQQNPLRSKGSEPVAAVAIEMMQALPRQYFPESLDEVRYIIEIAYDYRTEGFYNGNAGSAVRFNGIITVKTYAGVQVYKSSVVSGDSAPFFVSYEEGTSISYLSGGAPNMGREVAEAMNVAFERLHNEIQ